IAAELQRIDSTCNRVDSLSLFLRKIGFREQRIDSHDPRIDSEEHRGQFDRHMHRFYPCRVNSYDDPFLKKFSKCFESIRRVVESIH
ncbi:hypothetical protein PIB30_084988, partial [Stylosanthes scabra]|nr:hypothetical protein [Stylosanthes scabra]